MDTFIPLVINLMPTRGVRREHLEFRRFGSYQEQLDNEGLEIQVSGPKLN